MTVSRCVLKACLVTAIVLQAALAQAAPTATELAGHARTAFPFFEYVRAVNANAAVQVAIDPTRFASVVGQTCDIYVVAAKNAAQWAIDSSLTDVTTGGALTQTFSGTNIQGNTFQVAAALELNANAGLGLGVGYDVVLDCDQNGSLSEEDFIDGLSDEAGFYAVHDTTAAGPLAVTEAPLYSIDPAVGATFGIPATKLAEDLYYPTNIGSMGKLPLIIIGRGNGHNYQWYDHIGFHLASYGYVVMSHDNNTEPGVESAATTTQGHTDAFIDQAEAGAIAGGALSGHLDTQLITWIGHSRGAEGVAIAYDRLFDGSHTPIHFSMQDIRLISSMLPTDFSGTANTNPHNANYHLWTASGDSDVDGSAGCNLCQTFHIHDRATGYRQSTVVQGTGHAWFHDGPESPDWFDGPCSIGPTNDLTHLIQLGYFLPLIKHYVEGNIPALDFLTRQYETFRPIGVPTGNACIVVSNEYRNGSATGNFVIDDFQAQPGTGNSSSGGMVTFDVENLTEDRLDDNNSDFTWNAADPFNGATQAAAADSSRGVVFDWTDQDRFYEWEVVAGQRDFAAYAYLSLRGAQGSRHPNTLAAVGDLTFSVTLRDGAGVSSTINIGTNGGGLEEPYQRDGGWHNEMETVRIRTTDFLNNGSSLNLGDIVAVRLNVGPSWGSSRGRVVVDELMLTNDQPAYGYPVPDLRIWAGAIWQHTGTACSGDSCPGWTRLDNNVKTVDIAAGGDNLCQLHFDGWIWRATGTPCSGDSCPGWTRLDNNPKTIAIAAGAGQVFQLHNDGLIWQSTGTPCSGDSCPGWRMLDNNPATVSIEAGGDRLYQLHRDGRIWEWTGAACAGTSCPGWRMLDNNPSTVGIWATNGQLFQLHYDGRVWRYTGTTCAGASCPGWVLLDNNPSTVDLSVNDGNLFQRHRTGNIWRSTGAACSGASCPGWTRLDNNPRSTAINGGVYQDHHDGRIWRSTGAPCAGDSCPGWLMLDNNPRTKFSLAADNNNSRLYQLHAPKLYQLHNDGSIWQSTGDTCNGNSCPGWQRLDNNPRTRAIAASAGRLYQLHDDGKIWRSAGRPCVDTSCPGWELIDNNPRTRRIVSGGGQLYQLHNDGRIWRFTGRPCAGTSCPGWVMLDKNPNTDTIVADGGQLYQKHRDGRIWRFAGSPCSGNSCPSWVMLDNNPRTRKIVAGGGLLHQLHEDGRIWTHTGQTCSGSSCPGWRMMDNNPRTVDIVAGGRELYQRHNDGRIWESTGVPCSGSSCPGWRMMDNNPRTRSLTAAGGIVYQLHDTGWIWRSDGRACAGSSCPGWVRLDNNSRTTAVEASRE